MALQTHSVTSEATHVQGWCHLPLDWDDGRWFEMFSLPPLRPLSWSRDEKPLKPPPLLHNNDINNNTHFALHFITQLYINISHITRETLHRKMTEEWRIGYFNSSIHWPAKTKFGYYHFITVITLMM